MIAVFNKFLRNFINLQKINLKFEMFLKKIILKKADLVKQKKSNLLI